MEQGIADNSPRSLSKFNREKPSNRSFTQLINLVNQGIKREDKDGRPINQNDANFVIALGISGLRAETVWARQHPGYTNIDPSLIKQARSLIKANGRLVDEYINRLKTGDTFLSISQLGILNLIETPIS